MQRTLTELIEQSGLRSPRHLSLVAKLSTGTLSKIRKTGHWENTTVDKLVAVLAQTGATDAEVSEALRQLHDDYRSRLDAAGQPDSA